MDSEKIHNKFAEKTQEKSENYKEIFFNDHTVMLLIDPVTLKIVDANLAAINFYGYDLDEFANLKISDINIASDDYVLDKIQKSVSKQKNHFIFKHQLSNGEIRDVEVYSGLIKQNGKTVLYSIIHDITDNELQNTLKRFYTILSSMYGAILLVSDNNQVEFVNQAFCDFFKLNESPKDLMGLNDYEIIEKIKNMYSNPDEAILRISDIVSNGKPVKGEEIDLQDGRTCIRDFIPLNISKKSYGRLWHHTDITERKEAENELKESENRFRTFFENIMDAVLLTIPDGTILAANPAAEQLFGYTEEEICKIGRNGLLDTQDPNLPILIKERALQGKVKGELTFIRKNGSKFPGEMSTSVFKDGSGNERTSMVIRDITERRKVEEEKQELLEKEQKLTEELTASNEELQSITEELHKSNEELRQYSEMLSTIYDLNPDAIVLTTLSDSKIIDCNQEYLNQIGYTREETIGRTSTELNLLNSEERIDYIDETREKKSVSNYELRVRRKDGLFIDVQYSARYITVNNEPIILNIGHDISNRKMRDKKLKEAMDELIRSNKELERFAYVSSHDLQEPLRMITLYSQLLERRYKDSLDDDADDFIEYIVENAKRMKYLIDDLLEYSRVTSQAKEFENIDFEKLLDNVLSNLSILISENSVNVTHESLPMVFADKNQMLQVFQNLISNAIKFRGKVSPKIDISARKVYEEWIFAVKDNGIGISPKHREQIFEVFKRLHTREEYPGTGIGLSIAQKIVERHNGRIWVESELGEGSTFYFTIPL